MITRRQFLLGASGAIGLASLPLVFNTKVSESWLVSAFSNNQQQHFAGAFDAKGRLINAVALPTRGHGAVAHPLKPGHAIVYARRPGTFLMEVDFNHGQIIKQVNSTNGHHFFGHGAFSQDGKVLMSVENNFAKGRGEIVLRDSQTYQTLETYDCGGVGPHECKLMPDGKTLVIANGGIATHPQSPRKKLNLDTMSPALTYLDLSNGKVIDHFRLANNQLSIRHLDVSSQGKVIAGLQYQGAKADQVPLAVSHHGQSSLNFLKADETIWQRLNQYTASVCIDEINNQVAISCPRGDLITLWDLKTDTFIKKVNMRDVAGLSMNNNQLIATNGKGQTAQVRQTPLQPHHFNDIRWDNHLTTLTGI
jgi:hypothetical protein